MLERRECASRLGGAWRAAADGAAGNAHQNGDPTRTRIAVNSHGKGESDLQNALLRLPLLPSMMVQIVLVVALMLAWHVLHGGPLCCWATFHATQRMLWA